MCIHLSNRYLQLTKFLLLSLHWNIVSGSSDVNETVNVKSCDEISPSTVVSTQSPKTQ